MAYLWTTAQEIQNYLDTMGTIQIDRDETDELEQGETFTHGAAEQHENEAVYEIATFLSIAFKSEAAEEVETGIYGDTPLGLRVPVEDPDNPPPDTPRGIDCPGYIRLLAAKYTAAKIGMTRIGASLGTLPNWIRQYENDVFAQLRRLLVNADKVGDVSGEVPGLVWNGCDLNEILMKMKTRSQAVIEVES